MKRYLALLSLLTACAFAGSLAVAAPEKDPLKPRVPKSERGAAKRLKPPYGSTKKAPPEVIAEGKRIFEGEGTCVNCHGKKGDGQGPAGKALPIGPRNFTNCKFHKRRKDGELFWVIKNGSPNTPMVAMVKPQRPLDGRASLEGVGLRADLL